MGRGDGDNEQLNKDFIKGKSNKAKISIDPVKMNKNLGYSPTLKKASAAGTHGTPKRKRHKLDRREEKRKSRDMRLSGRYDD